MDERGSAGADIIVLPRYAELKSEIARLKEEIPTVLQERDDLVLIECANIEMRYMIALGALECRLFREECDHRRLTRKMEMIRAALNRREKPDVDAIERKLDIELEEYEARLDEQYEHLERMVERSKGTPLTDAEMKEMKKIYHRVVKELHPDLHPDLSDREKILFLQAAEAYANGDIARLKVINEAVADRKGTGTLGTLQELSDEKERLTAVLEGIRTEIEEIKKQFPYNIKDMLEDEALIEERRKDLTETIELYAEKSAELEMIIMEMLETNG